MTPVKPHWRESSGFAILAVLAALIVVWYVAAVLMNWQGMTDLYQRKDVTGVTVTQQLYDVLNADKPLLPAPHQVVAEFWKTTVEQAVTSKKSLVYHGWITLSATLLGFVIGTGFGIGLAVLIVHNGAMDRSLMPWIIASQTIPILAIAPMVIVVLNAVGISGLVPKALISTYLSFFPVVVGMVKGFRSPEAIQLDLMRTYSASRVQTFIKLRWPIALPYLFTSMKVGVAASLVGAIVGELPAGGGNGLGGAAPGGLLLRADDPDLVGAADGIAARRRLDRAGEPCRTDDQSQPGSAGMTGLQRALAAAAGGLALLALIFEFAATEGAPLPVWEFPLVGAFLVLAVLSGVRIWLRLSLWVDGALAAFGAMALMLALETIEQAGPGYWFALVSAWVFAWLFAERLTRAVALKQVSQAVGVLIPAIFGIAILIAWEAITRGGQCAQGAAAVAFGYLADADRERAQALGRFPADVLEGRADRLCARLRGGVCGGDCHRPLAVPQARAAAGGQFRLGAAADRHCADHGHLVRL